MPDNYNILEPTSAPSGTTTRTIRAVDVGSGNLAGAAVLVNSSGTALLNVQNRSNSIPVTIANEDTVELTRYRVSVFSNSVPGGTHTPALPSGVTNDILVDGNQPVAGDFLCANTSGSTITRTFNIPVVSGGYTDVSILINYPTAPSGGAVTMNIFPNANSNSTSFVQSSGGQRALFLIPFMGGSLTAGATLTTDVIALSPFTRATNTVLVQFSIPSGVTAGTFRLVITRSR